ncbi:Ankyrin repeat domain-containing protein 31 [Quillaja saponaria]|uniref:Ankyrin repeat domain-containing protein 31 n=1 Tax=Quillaja saponaria TaxID=32244 RepID=A0AAD7Q658_QUISA|nr:Ankyrin repeat domain-containing protein 31 [Quillaja saponaria]
MSEFVNAKVDEAIPKSIAAPESEMWPSINEPLEDGSYPIHRAAESLSPKMIDLLIHRGARTDVRCAACFREKKIYDKDRPQSFYGYLPIEIAINSFCEHLYFQDWNSKKSIFLLLYAMALPKLSDSLKAISVLASHTDNIEVIACKYAKKGSLKELATLLTVAWKKLLPPITSEGESENDVGYTEPAIRRCILSELQSLVDEEVRLIGTSKSIKEAAVECKQKKAKMEIALLLLEVFERTGSGFDIYLSLDQRAEYDDNVLIAHDIMWMLKNMGFNLTRSDTNLTSIDCFTRKLSPDGAKKLRSLLKRASKNPTRPAAVPIYNPNLQNSSTSEENPTLGGVRSMSTAIHCRPVSLFTFPQARSYHTCGIISAPSTVSRLSNPVGSSVSGLMKTLEPILSNNYAGKPWSILALAVQSREDRTRVI